MAATAVIAEHPLVAHFDYQVLNSMSAGIHLRLLAYLNAKKVAHEGIDDLTYPTFECSFKPAVFVLDSILALLLI